MRRLLVNLIERYQAGGGGRRYFAVTCNFEPTCSEYTRQAILDRGTLRGLKLGFKRIRRCNQQGLKKPIADPYVHTGCRDSCRARTPSASDAGAPYSGYATNTAGEQRHV